MDMSGTIAPKSEQINADDFLSGPRTVTIRDVKGNDGNAEQPVNVFIDGNNKPYRPCKQMRRVMVAIWGSDAREYVGRSMTLYRDPEVTWGGMKVGGIRISHMSHMDREVTLALTVTQKQRKPYVVKPLQVEQPRNPGVSAEDALAIAKTHAAKGKDAFLLWYNSDEGKTLRETIKPHMDSLKDICTQADAAANDDPFGLPPTDEAPSLTDDEEARIRREIEEENRRQAEGV